MDHNIFNNFKEKANLFKDNSLLNESKIPNSQASITNSLWSEKVSEMNDPTDIKVLVPFSSISFANASKKMVSLLLS